MKKIVPIKIITFIAGLLFIWCGTDYILERPKDQQWDHSGLAYIYDNRNYYDVIFVGTSITITNLSNEELYLNHGIAGVTIGEPSQATYLSYYSLEEALKYQTPAVVVFDVNSLFYTEDDLITNVGYSEHHHLHYSFDNMKTNLTKYRAFCQAKEIIPELDFWNYFSKIYYNHSNWENLSQGNFNRESDKMIMNGNLMLLSFQGGSDNVEEEYTEDVVEIPEINLQYLYKMIELCNEKNISFVLARGGGSFSEGKYNTLNNLSREYGIPYLDLSDYKEDAGIDMAMDCVDGTHFNVLGAQKWTNVIGEYLKNHYVLPDRRQDAKYDSYREKETFYRQTLKGMRDMIILSQCMSLDDYLNALMNLDYSDTSVFISVKDEASTNLTYNEVWQMNELGLSAELKNKFRYSYIGIFGEAGIHELLGEEQLYYTGAIGEDTIYSVMSSGGNVGNQASIMINGIEMAQNGRGINIVVYNSILDKVISSVYFDTYQYENPPTARISTVSQEQYEAEPNIWLPLENYQAGEIQ